MKYVIPLVACLMIIIGINSSTPAVVPAKPEFDKFNVQVLDCPDGKCPLPQPAPEVVKPVSYSTPIVVSEPVVSYSSPVVHYSQPVRVATPVRTAAARVVSVPVNIVRNVVSRVRARRHARWCH